MFRNSEETKAACRDKYSVIRVCPSEETYELDIYCDIAIANSCGESSCNLRHQRFGHLRSANLETMLKYNMVTGRAR